MLTKDVDKLIKIKEEIEAKIDAVKYDSNENTKTKGNFKLFRTQTLDQINNINFSAENLEATINHIQDTIEILKNNISQAQFDHNMIYELEQKVIIASI